MWWFLMAFSSFHSLFWAYGVCSAGFLVCLSWKVKRFEPGLPVTRSGAHQKCMRALASPFSWTCVTSLFGSSFWSGPEALSHSDFDENLPSMSIASNHIPFEPSCVCLSCVISQVPFPPSLPLHPCPLNKISHRPGKSQVGCLVTEPRGLPVSAFLELGV